jgi:hypothetical protein
LGESGGWFLAWFSPNAIHGGSQFENLIKNQYENRIPLWEPPNIGDDTKF